MHAINVDYHWVRLGMFDCGCLVPVSKPMLESPANDQADLLIQA